jgi:hypothetical protein
MGDYERVFKKRFPRLSGGNSNRLPGYMINRQVGEDLLKCRKEIKKDWDMFFVIDGEEGTGKSVLAQQLAFFCDRTLTIDRVVFRASEFKEAVLKAKKREVIIWDEAYGGMASRKAMSAVNHMLIDLMAEIRQRNLFVFMVLPSFFELDKYAAIHRSRTLFHVYHNKFRRGFYHVYKKSQKQKMYLFGKKNYNYKIVKKPGIRCARFADFYTVDREAYKKKKTESLRAMDKEAEEDEPSLHRRGDIIKINRLTKLLIDIGETFSIKEREDFCLRNGFPKTFIRSLRERFNEDKYSKEMEMALKKQKVFHMP